MATIAPATLAESSARGERGKDETGSSEGEESGGVSKSVCCFSDMHCYRPFGGKTRPVSEARKQARRVGLVLALAALVLVALYTVWSALTAPP